MRSGFVVLIGRSNVGKSTLLNALVGTKIAITTPKPQTTRMPIRGIVTEARGQAVFVDTPGIFAKKFNQLTARLNMIVRESLDDVDLILYVVDPTRAIGKEEETILRLIKQAKKPKILVINKIDEPDKYFLDEYTALQDQFDDLIQISALRSKNLKELKTKIFELLPEGEPTYPAGQLTDLETRAWVEELIREKIFLAMHEEIPYTVALRVEEMDKRKNKKGQEIIYIKASVLTTSDRYKKMLIGAGARQIREIGQAARRELEGAMNGSVFLDLEVVVESRWQNFV